MKRIYSILVAMLVGTMSLLAQTNYTITFKANVTMDKIQVKNLQSGVTKTLNKSDNVITLQKVAKQGGTGTPVESVEQSDFLQQTASNEVTVNMEKAGRLNLMLYSSNGTFVARYSNNVDAGQTSFQIGASSGVYALVASANNQKASLKIILTQSTQPSILEVLTNKPESVLKSINDVITFDDGDEFEFTGYYYSQTKVETMHSAFINGDKQIRFSFTKVSAPTVTTVKATNITTDAATVGGNVTSDNGTSVTERGVCWGTSANPTVSNNKKASGTGTGSFTVTLSSLSDATTYYVRAYAINAEGTSYGDEITFTTTKKATAPTVTTTKATNIKTNAATVGGNVTNDNGATVTERGVCWATTANPTVSNNKKASGTGTGSFTITLSTLSEETTYYVRAYAINSVGISYGSAITFTTQKVTAPEFDMSLRIGYIGLDNAYVSGSVYEKAGTGNGATVTERGVCWATTKNPTVSNNKKALSGNNKVIELYISPLSQGTTYYVRPYAIHTAGITYGDQKTFTTKKPATIANGAIQKAFSVSETRKVYFSQGNLQYQASTGTWRFAEHQYDMIGSDNSNISSSYSGWIDLFGWGTSGYNGKYPYMTSTESSDYGDGMNDIAGTNYDWGVYNKISNGGNQAGMWRTLTGSELDYLINKREGRLRGLACVNGVNGLILLPDDHLSGLIPDGLKFTSGATDYTQNVYSASEWSKMEAIGAVFLPAAGTRSPTTGMKNVGSKGFYWLASHNPNYKDFASFLYFYSSGMGYGDINSRYLGYSVRLVQDVK